MGQAWNREMSADYSKLFTDWCSDLTEINTMAINHFYFENGCTNLKLHIFTDASEVMCNVSYPQNETALNLTYVKGKSRLATIRHMTIPK